MAKKKKERSSAPKLGAAYQATKFGLQVASPVIDSGFQAAGGGGFDLQLRNHLGDPTNRNNYLKGVSVALLDAWGSKKAHIANAISRNSVSAIAVEALTGWEAGSEADLDPQNSLGNFSAKTDGYHPQDGQFSFDTAKPYLIRKYVAAAARYALTRLPFVGRPIHKFTAMLGVNP